MKNRLYAAPNARIDYLIKELEDFFSTQGHQVQVLPISGGQVLQAQKETTLGALTGQSTALTIKMIPQAQGIYVEVGSSKWIDKAAVGVIGYIILPPLILIPIIGMYNQYKLGEDAWRIIDSFFARYYAETPAQPHQYSPPYTSSYSSGPQYASNPYPPNPPSQQSYSAPVQTPCVSCGAGLPVGAAFCSGCGTRVASGNPICHKCNTTNTPGSRFCSGCGSRFDS